MVPIGGYSPSRRKTFCCRDKSIAAACIDEGCNPKRRIRENNVIGFDERTGIKE